MVAKTLRKLLKVRFFNDVVFDLLIVTAKRQSEKNVKKLLFAPRKLAFCKLELLDLSTLFRALKKLN